MLAKAPAGLLARPRYGYRAALTRNNYPNAGLLEILRYQVSFYCLSLGVRQSAIVHDDLADVAREVRVEITTADVAAVGRRRKCGQFAAGTQHLLTVYVERVGGSALNRGGQREVGSDGSRSSVVRQI